MKFSLDWLRSYVDLPEPAEEVGEMLAQAGLPLDSAERWGADTILDVDVLANRPDCMCHLGLARELAARNGRKLSYPEARPATGSEAAATLASVTIADADLCSRYTALVLTDVRVGPSPDWIQDRLASIGLRPINNLVDATNFVLHELGQPLHAFDLDQLTEGRIIVRRALAGERLATLDGVDRDLEDSDLVIADGSRGLALAGVMGGAQSEISHETTRVLIESAHFAAAAIRRTSRRLGMHTDASHRFERGTDPGITMTAALRTAALMLESCEGTLAEGAVDVVARPQPATRLSLTMARTRALLGMELAAGQVREALEPLGFSCDPGQEDHPETLMVTVPTWRVDVGEEVDLIEEVGRMVGYDQVPARVPSFSSTTAGRPRPQSGAERARSFLAAAGFSETISFPMAVRAQQETFRFPLCGERQLVALDNPMNRQMETMRASLLPGLLTGLVHNRNHGAEDARLFEVGRVFVESTGEPAAAADPLPLPQERTLLAAVATGEAFPQHWLGRPARFDFFDLKGALEGALRRAGAWEVAFAGPGNQPLPPFLDAGSASWVWLDGAPAGWIGLLKGSALSSWDLTGPPLAFEVDVSMAPAVRPATSYVPLPRHPSADRDLAIVLPETIRYDQVQQLVQKQGGALLESVSLFDRYQGHPIPDGHISLAIRLVFRAPDRTLRAAEVQEALERVVGGIRHDLQGEIRDAKS